MSAATDPHPIAIVTARMKADGLPTFILTTVEVTDDEQDNGVHYYLAAGHLLEQGYDEPFLHFDEFESPPFLHSAVKDHLGLHAENPAANNLVLQENP